MILLGQGVWFVLVLRGKHARTEVTIYGVRCDCYGF